MSSTLALMGLLAITIGKMATRSLGHVVAESDCRKMS